MTAALFTHPSCLAHDTGPGHPESAARLAAILEALNEKNFPGLVRLQAPAAKEEQIARVHDPMYVTRVKAAIAAGAAALDGDTAVCPASWEAALHAAGAAVAAVDWVMQEPQRRAFCAVRPPGHHAEPDAAMGFCLFNNIAIGAAHALSIHKLARVAILDFDVHHGNGTEAWAIREPRALFCSSHQWPLYPGTGRAGDQGPLGNIINTPLPPASGSGDFRAVWNEQILPAVAGFRPELIFISAGFDAHRADPLANLALDEGDFAWLTQEICALANEYCAGRTISALEGGYDLRALVASAIAHMQALMA